MERSFHYLTCISGLTDGLISCVCLGTSCSSATCQGEICFSKVLSPGAEQDHRKGCYFNSQVQQCNTTSALHTTLCCHGNLCNEELNPTLSPTQAPGELSPDPISPSEARGNSDHTLSKIKLLILCDRLSWFDCHCMGSCMLFAYYPYRS